MIDWTKLAIDTGSMNAAGDYVGGNFSALALETIIGDENIANAVEIALEGGPGSGSEFVVDVLSFISSPKALELAYQAYKTSTGQRASTAVYLIMHIRNVRSKEWIEEFLLDDNVAAWGIWLLDLLVLYYFHYLDPQEVERLVGLAEHHKQAFVRERAAIIRESLQDSASLQRQRIARLVKRRTRRKLTES